jgi:hypothetical protein
MNHIERAFVNAWDAKVRKGWDRIYVLVDVHGVIYEPDYTKVAEKVYPVALEPLRKMTEDDSIKLILWTCSREKDIEKYRAELREHGIEFDWVNRNPEVEHVEALGDYRNKLYANVILDDKAGFDPAEDWDVINSWLHLPNE